MKIRFFLVFFLMACLSMPMRGADDLRLKSPDGRMEVTFRLVDGKPYYELARDGKPVVLPSRMGFELEWRDDLAHAFVQKEVQRSTFDEVWHPVWGEEANIRNHYNEMLVTLEQPVGSVESMDHSTEKRPTVMQIRFRLYDDGLGFRYEFPMRYNGIDNALVCFWFKEELTQFALTGDHTAWWIPGDYDTQEYNYTESRLSQIDSLYEKGHEHGGWPWTDFSRTGVQTALQMRTDDGLYINIHEAATLDYPTMHLNLEKPFTFRTWLCPDAAGYKGRMQAPCHTPWRTVMVCDKATDALRSRLILNLNDPCALEDVSWIHPVKYMGVWWEMISGKSTWSYTNDFPSVKLGETDFVHAKPNGTHGANNANVRRYIDFAAKHGFDALLIEGWNVGWEDWYGKQKDFVFDFLTPYPDFDLPALNRYAHEKGIRLVMHHESSASTVNYERWMEKAYTLMNKYGYDAVKSGYVGTIIPFAEGHYSQPINNHYHYAIVEAAKHHIMVNAHEAVRPTGLCRTWPNMIGNESAMGTEFRERIHPGHTSILPFTRLQGGPMDYTPGIFEPDMGKIVPWGKPMSHTICNQLGLYVTFYSPLQMAADFPEHYAPYMDAFQFIKDVAVDWDTSIYLYAEPGDYIVTARKPKLASLNKAAEGVGKLPDGKKGVVSSAAQYVYGLTEPTSLTGLTPRDVWYIGGITDETAREFSVKLDFLTPGKTYEAIIYTDGKDASGLPGDTYNPYSYTITTKKVTSKTTLKLKMASCGGFAVSIRERQ
ncbi:MAG: glycoside hydrolase family 97 protein [Bacteroidales bacterium]|nr:glycoside hydrolase family 97 protein [Bacteroidales bacterium]